MSIVIVLCCIALLILLITHFKINAFLAFLVISILAGLLLGIDVSKITTSVQKGIGDMLGSLVVIIVSGAMLGKLVAESGAAQQIAAGMMKIFGEKYIQWALMVTGFVIGIPLFYNVGFVLVVPLIFSVAYRYNLPVVYIGLPMLASLSVTHGFLPPHPSPTALVAQFHADMGTTLLYGIIIGIPTVILAGPIFSKTLKNIKAPIPKTFQSSALPEDQLPGLGNSVISSLLPVLFLALTTLTTPRLTEGVLKKIMSFLGDPAIVMLLALAIATYTLGVKMGTSLKKIMDIYSDAVKDIAMLLLIMSGAGALKQVLIDSGVSNEIANLLGSFDAHPLVLGWALACLIRVCVGSATVAGLTAAGIVAPLLDRPGVDPNLMVLAVGAGSLMFSHVNDAGFWLFKEYFNLSIKDTIRSWSLMETIVAIAGLIGVMALHYLL
ncbi:MAG: gluconate transporter [Cyclobacteriaceae bacterium]|nr:gluconate transporter [Cyclobacteriaceae bacterium]